MLRKGAWKRLTEQRAPFTQLCPIMDYAGYAVDVVDPIGIEIGRYRECRNQLEGVIEAIQDGNTITADKLTELQFAIRLSAAKMKNYKPYQGIGPDKI